MIRTSHRGPMQRSMFRCVVQTQWAPDCSAACSWGARTGREGGEDVCKRPATPAMLPSRPLYTWAGREIV
ncbi:unnamed protein product, partial [Staurois parvus]